MFVKTKRPCFFFRYCVGVLLLRALLVPVGIFASPADRDGRIEVPSIKTRADFPIFSIFREDFPWHSAQSHRRSDPYSLNIILAVWRNGYCIASSDDTNGGPPYKGGFLAEATQQSIMKKLRSFNPPQNKSIIALDAPTETTIAIRDEYTSKSFALRLPDEEYYLNEPCVYYKEDLPLLEAWKNLRQFGKMIDKNQISSQENDTFSLQECPPPRIYTAVVFRHVGSDRKLVHPVILNSREEGYHAVLQDIPMPLIVLCQKEAVTLDTILALHTILIKNDKIRGASSGTAEISFYGPEGKETYTLDLDQMSEIRKRWSEFSPVPSSVVRYFEEMGQIDEK